ncbi:MAG: hypothetical protein O2894_09305 [Planctomycetota bacterium]|nr:hypothetical protein [Planctomycetota bacterium]
MTVRHLPLLLVLVLGLAVSACRSSASPPTAARSPGLAAGLEAGMFPNSWSRPGIEVAAAPLPPERVPTAHTWLTRALAVYPPGFVEQNVERIHLLGALSFRGVDAGGSNSRRRLYVVVPRGPGAEAYFRRVVHAEFSSVLWRRHRALLDLDAWVRGTVPGFRYGASGAAAVRHGLADAQPTTWALQQGFLYEYGMSSIENDFNSYAGFLFGDPERLAAFAAQHPGVAHKRALTAAFYRALDARFAFGVASAAPPRAP